MEPVGGIILKRYVDCYSFKRCPFGLQNMAFRLLIGILLRGKRMPIANQSKVRENRK